MDKIKVDYGSYTIMGRMDNIKLIKKNILWQNKII